jgi:argininosuccinate lyase
LQNKTYNYETLGKGIPTDKKSNNVGNDRELVWFWLKYDALGSIAHAKMLGNIGLLSTETNSLVSANDIIADMKETLSLKIHLKMYTPKSSI